jgi:acetyltransferase-like isoleucine patch superfamily enzyme
MSFLNRLRGIYQQMSQTLRYKIAALKYIRKRIRFNGKIDIASSSKLRTGSGEIVFKGFAELGEFTLLNAYNGCIEIGINTHIGPFACIYGQGNVTIADNVLIGPGAKILSSNHSIEKHIPIRFQPDLLKPTVIKNDVWIGANAVILGGVTIETGAIVGAGSIVTKDIPSYAVALGNPAKIVKYRE